VSGLKAYTLGNHGFVPTHVREALGQPIGRNQASVVIVAASKKAAVTLAEQVGVRVSYTDSEFRRNDGPATASVVAFTDGQPGVFASPRLRRPGDPIVELLPDGWRLVGRYRQGGIDWTEER